MSITRRKRYSITGMALSATTFLAATYLIMDPNVDGALTIASLLTAGLSGWLAGVFHSLYKKARADEA